MEKEKQAVASGQKSESDQDPFEYVSRSIMIDDHKEYEADWDGKVNYYKKHIWKTDQENEEKEDDEIEE